MNDHKMPSALKQCCENRILIVTGHYGSGKTEFALNLAKACAEEGKRTALVDIDIVNPYFRSREMAEPLEEMGIRLITTIPELRFADIPALPGDIAATYDDPNLFSIFDVGGDPVGAKVLGRYSDKIRKVPYDFLVVINANRPRTKTPEKAVQFIRSIESACRLKATGIVDNTHLGRETTEEDLELGRKLAEGTSQLTGLPIICHTVEKRLMRDDMPADVFPVDINFKKPWEL